MFLAALRAAEIFLALNWRRFFRSLMTMEVQFAPDVEKQLNDLAAQSGRGSAAELVRVVVEGYFAEVLEIRRMLDSRYDDLKSGRVKPIPGDEVIARLRARSEAYRKSRNETL